MGGPHGGFQPTGQEKSYTATQMIHALKNSMHQVKEQLGVLAILDGTAASWPGINQAIDDMTFITDMSAQTTTRLEADGQAQEARADRAEDACASLREELKESRRKCDELQKDNNQLVKDSRALTKNLETSQAEVASQREEIWKLEQRNADLGKELDKVRVELMVAEGEVGVQRETIAVQVDAIGDLREQLAALRADVSHYDRENVDLKGQVDELRRQLDATSNSLRKAQATLEHTRNDKEVAERELHRIRAELTKTSAELTKVSAEFLRQKEWTLVVKKVEADKLREAEGEHNRAAIAWEQMRSELEQANVRLETEGRNKEAVAAAKTHDAAALAKQVNLLGINVRDQQKSLSVHVANCAALSRERDALKGTVAELQAKLTAGSIQVARMDKERAVEAAKVREFVAVNTAKLAAGLDEARKESAVQKTLSEGWARDLRAAQAQLRQEQKERGEQQRVVEELLRDEPGKAAQLETVKQVATLEQMIRDLKGKLSGKDTEMKRLRAEAGSAAKQAEGQVRALKRECNEGALEVARLRAGDALHLPRLHRPAMLADELDELKRAVGASVGAGIKAQGGAGGGGGGGAMGGGGGGASRLPAASGAGVGRALSSGSPPGRPGALQPAWGISMPSHCEMSGEPYSHEIGIDDWLDPISFGEEEHTAAGAGLNSYDLDPDGFLEGQQTGHVLSGDDLDIGHAHPMRHASAMRASFSMNDLMAHSAAPLSLPLPSVPWHRGTMSPLEPVPEGGPAPQAGLDTHGGMGMVQGAAMYAPPAPAPFPIAMGMHQQQLAGAQQLHGFMGARLPAAFQSGAASFHLPGVPTYLAQAHPGMMMPAGVKIEEGVSDPMGLSSTQSAQAAAQQLQQQQASPGGLRKSHSALELGAWRKVAAGELDAFVSPSTREQLLHLEGLGNLGRLTPAERLQKILRYRAKRQMRNFNPTIKYQCRKSLADTRPRVRGRFARDNEPGSVMPHETKKAIREKGMDGEGDSGGGACDDQADGCGGGKGRGAEPSGSGSSAGTSMGHDARGPLAPGDSTKKTLVLDLDETLVHSSFKPVPNPDFIIPVDIDGKSVDVFVLKRPWCDHFLARMGEMYEANNMDGTGPQLVPAAERGRRPAPLSWTQRPRRSHMITPQSGLPTAIIHRAWCAWRVYTSSGHNTRADSTIPLSSLACLVVVFTASLAKYADPLLDLLDKGNVIRWRLFRESCVLYEGNYVKNLATLGRKLKDIVIIDNSPHSYVFQPENSMPVSTFIDDMEDRELLDLLPMLAQVEMVDDVRLHLERVCSHARTSNGGRLEPILPL
ncbi:hypothetical protein FOA52_013901 [Chlamydomonas sp. UWO 241]|nr:hypothetical protein FOA52_013901 [Chlamydomonas sp. UWO 241]